MDFNTKVTYASPPEVNLKTASELGAMKRAMLDEFFRERLGEPV